MLAWRKRWRKRLFTWTFPAVVGENPLELAMIMWGLFTVINTLLGQAPSAALQALPDPLEVLWAILLGLGGATVMVALRAQRDYLIASGMYLFAATMTSYAVAIISASGWSRGGAVAAFMLIIGLVCFLRGWWLKEVEATLIRQMVRNRDRGN